LKVLLELYHAFNQLICPHRNMVRQVVLIPETAVTPAEVHVYLECMECLKRTPGIHFDAPASTVEQIPWRVAS